MRLLLILILGFLVPVIGYSQYNEYDELFTELDTMPSYKGGEDKLIEFFSLNSTHTYSKERNHEGFVSLNFVVDKEGKVQLPKVLVASSKELEKEVIKIILLTIWNPGIRKGKPVNTSMNVLVNLKK